MAQTHDGAQKRWPGEHASLSDPNLLRQVFESVVNGVSIADATADDLPLIYVNSAFERMTGYGRDEFMGRNCRFLQCGESPHSELMALRTAIHKRSDVRVVLKNFTKQGALFWNELYLSPIIDGEGRLTHFVGFQNDITARVLLRQQLEHIALPDNLTDLANRSLLIDRLGTSLNGAKRHGRMLAVLFIDLDSFKDVNDQFGHDDGDQLLRIVGARLKHACRESDCAARIGGDEFVFLVGGLAHEADAEDVAGRIEALVQVPISLHGEHIVLRTSIEVSVSPRDGTSAEELLKAADAAMYRQKISCRERSAAQGQRATSEGTILL